jgi:predicted nucleotidyltransferase
MKPMSRDDALSLLGTLLPSVRRDFHVRRLAIFGSTARGEAKANSDLDLLVDFEEGLTFDSFMGLKLFLEDRLDRRVDQVTPEGPKPRPRQVVEREAVDVA